MTEVPDARLNRNKAASLRDLPAKVLDGTVVLSPRGLARESDGEVAAIIKRWRGIGVVLAGIVAATAALAGTAQAATAMNPLPGGGGESDAPATIVRTVMVGACPAGRSP